MTELEKNNPLIALSVLYDKNICNNIKKNISWLHFKRQFQFHEKQINFF